MAITFSCPQCGKMVRIGDEYAGRKGRCPSCLTVIDIPAASMAVEPLLEVPDEAGPTPGRGKALAGPAGAAWKTVYGGLGFIFGGSLTIGITLVVIFVVAFAAGLLAGARAVRGPQAENVLLAGICVGSITGIFGVMLILVGVKRCCSAPSASGAHGAAVVTAFFACFATVVLLIAIITNVADQAERGPADRGNPNPGPFGQQRAGRPEPSPAVKAMQLIGQVFTLATQIALTVFLGRVGRYFGNDTMTTSSVLLLILLVVMNVLGFVFTRTVDLADLPHEPAYLLFALLLLAGFLGIFVWFLILVYQARAAIDAALRRPLTWDA